MKTKHIVSAGIGIVALAGHSSAEVVGHEKYTYDGFGNVIEKSVDGHVTKMSYDQSNKITSTKSSVRGSEQINYDLDGRPTSTEYSAAKSMRQLSYGYADKVLKAVTSGGKAEFFYNAEGQLVGKSGSGKLTPYCWDGNVIATDGTESFVNEDHDTGGIPILSNKKNIIITDFIGNTLSNGKKPLLGTTAYGEGLEKARFTGKFYVEELESFIFHHRNYSPKIARWNTLDPSGFPDGINQLAYANNDPVSNYDPHGLAYRTGSDVGKLYNRTNECGSPGTTIKFKADGFVANKTVTSPYAPPVTSTEDVINANVRNYYDNLAVVLYQNFSVNYVAFTAKSLDFPIRGNSTMKIYTSGNNNVRYVYDAKEFVSVASGTALDACGGNIIAGSTLIGNGEILTVFEN
jgi:RHS repeat-associated protein